MKYKAGDRVRVKRDLVVGTYYDGWAFVEKMAKHRGEIVTIERSVFYSAYSLVEDGLNFGWTDAMLEDFKKTSYKVDSHTQTHMLDNSDFFFDILAETEE